MSKSFADLFYWKWHTAFYKAIGRREVYEARRLVQKLREALFFYKLAAEVVPSFRFWIRVQQTLNGLPTFVTESTFQSEGEEFVASEVNYLRERLQEVLLCFQHFPQVFIDLSQFYPRFNLKFEEIEFVYLDFWSQTPKVIDSLLKELLVRDQPLREPLAPLLLWAGEEKVLPPLPETESSVEENLSLMRAYFVEHARYPGFVEILTLYFKAWPQIREECLIGLLKINPEVSEDQLDDALAQYFIMYYLFKGVSSETLRFCAANAHFYTYLNRRQEGFFQDPFRKERDLAIIEWEGFTEAERQAFEAEREKRRPAYDALFAAAKRGRSSETE